MFRQVLEQPGLANTRFPSDQRYPRVTALDFVEQGPQPAQLLTPADRR